MHGIVLVIGSNGMLGREVYRIFSSTEYETHGTSRRKCSYIGENIHTCVDLRYPSIINKTLNSICPDVIINCSGITKHVSGQDRDMTYVNSVVPHDLSTWASNHDSMYIHVSTDCIFDGRSGNYSENDKPKPIDSYGMTKLLGETYDHLVIRTSFIGKENESKRGLLEWFLSQEGSTRGYTHALWSGLTATEIARIMVHFVRSDIKNGIYNVGGDVIDKYSLLLMIRDIFDKDIYVEKDDSVRINRSLDVSKFKNLKFPPTPPLEYLIKEIRDFEKVK